jgi:hypothetical protein
MSVWVFAVLSTKYYVRVSQKRDNEAHKKQKRIAYPTFYKS